MLSGAERGIERGPRVEPAAPGEAVPRRPARVSRKRVLAAALVLGLAAWFLPSLVNAERYRRRLEAGLEQALKRPVEFGAISLRLLPRPGFEVKNVVVREDPAFGFEPFATVDRVDCDLRWRSLLGPRLEFSRLDFDSPTINLVRNARGQWNVENLLLASRGANVSPASPMPEPPPALSVDVDSARLNFKIGDDKKPFAITDLTGRIGFDPARQLLTYRLTGLPVRTDLTLPTPGEIELEGQWTPRGRLAGLEDATVDATLRTRGALLYDWAPLVSGRNPGIYGLIDLTARLTGSVRVLEVEGQGEVTQFHRWGQPTPPDSRRLRVEFKGGLDRNQGRATLESADLEFGGSRLHVSGSVENFSAGRDLHLAFGLSGGQLDDLVALGRRLWTLPDRIQASGAVDGVLAIEGPWGARRYGGLVAARGVRVSTPLGAVPVSDATVRIDTAGVRLSPVRITLAPHLELVAQGAAGGAAIFADSGLAGASPRPKLRGATRVADAHLARGTQPDPSLADQARYELTLSAASWPVGDLLRLARAAGFRGMPGVEAKNGSASGEFHLVGAAWPLKPPAIEGRVELADAQFAVPGLSEPLGVRRALVSIAGDHLVAAPLEVTLGSNNFTGRLEHSGDARAAWRFELSTGRLSLDEGSLWFEALGHRTASRSILDLLPGLSSFDRRRAAAANLFGALNAQGVLRASQITSRSVNLGGAVVPLEVSGRVVRVTSATFRAAGGRGAASGVVDLTAQPARLSGDVALDGARLEALTPWLPSSLERLRGTASGSASFQATGLSRQEMGAHLEAQAALELKDVTFGDFDPLDAVAQECHWGALEPSRRRAAVRAAQVTVRVRDRRAWLKSSAIELAGARLDLAGSYSFDGRLDLAVHGDFTHVTRRWQTPPAFVVAGGTPVAGFASNGRAPGSASASAQDPAGREPRLREGQGLQANFHLAGPLSRLEVRPSTAETRPDPAGP